MSTGNFSLPEFKAELETLMSRYRAEAKSARDTETANYYRGLVDGIAVSVVAVDQLSKSED